MIPVVYMHNNNCGYECWPEAIAGADDPYSLITVFGRGHLAIKAGGAV
jgi:hypothetical protein